jgi:hypothetical protein
MAAATVNTMKMAITTTWLIIKMFFSAFADGLQAAFWGGRDLPGAVRPRRFVEAEDWQLGGQSER